jgi:hypothetical protein
MGAPEIEAFLSHLAQEANASASTQNQAFNALLFLFRNVLQVASSSAFRPPSWMPPFGVSFSPLASVCTFISVYLLMVENSSL